MLSHEVRLQMDGGETDARLRGAHLMSVPRAPHPRPAPSRGPESDAEPSDAALVQACVRGERRAAEQLIRRHRGWVLRLAMSRLHHAAEAEDVVQDVFVRLWQKADQWDAARGAFTTWLYTITVNRCIDALRRRRPTAPMEAAEEVADERADAAQAAAARAQNAQMRAALQTLPPPQRAALELVYFAEWPQARAADALGVSVAALESSLRRARAQLRTQLESQKSVLLSP